MSSNILIINHDITQLSVDAIVNAANNSLLGGGGVDGAIHRTAGPGLLEECRGLNGCKTGHAKLTKGYNLKAKYVIHTVGPVWKGGNNNEEELLALCYKACFQIVLNHSMVSVAFPAISTGVYGFPKERAAQIALAQANDVSEEIPELKILFCCFDHATREIYEQINSH